MEDGMIYAEHQFAKLFNIKNAVIWRYMDLPKFLSLILDKSLFYTRADKFEDKLEGEITRETKLLMFENMRVIKEKFPIVLNNLHSDDPEEYIEVLKDKTYVNCWHINKHESNTMWKAYAPGDYGIAIKSNTELLRNCFRIDSSEIVLGEVKYINVEVDITPTGLPHYVFLQKDSSYTHESEARSFFIELHSKAVAVPDNDRSQFGIKIPIDLNILIDGIYLKDSAPGWFRKNITDLLLISGLETNLIKTSRIQTRK